MVISLIIDLNYIVIDDSILDYRGEPHPRLRALPKFIEDMKIRPKIYVRRVKHLSRKDIEECLDKLNILEFFEDSIDNGNPKAFYKKFYGKLGIAYGMESWIERRKVLHITLGASFIHMPKEHLAKDLVCPGRFIANHYINCPYNCLYCFVPRYFRVEPLVAKLNAPEAIGKELKTGKFNGRVVDIGSNCDPLSELDEYFRLTPAIIKEFRQSKSYLYILTKSHRISHIIDVAKGMKNLLVGFTITHYDSKIKRIWEPHASTYEEIKESIKRLAENQIRVAIRIDPIIAGYNDDPEVAAKIISDLSDYIENVTVGTLRVVKPYTIRQIEAFNPKLAGSIEKLYVEPGFDRKWRISIHKRIEIYKAIRELCESKGIEWGLCNETRKVHQELKPKRCICMATIRKATS